MPAVRTTVLLLGAALVLDAHARPDPARTVVIANARVPESLEVARHYMERRGIPGRLLCELELPKGEAMTRDIYETGLRDPLLAFLRERSLVDQTKRDAGTVGRHESGWVTVSAKVNCLVPVFGVPLRIDDTRLAAVEKIARWMGAGALTDGAAVDSELAALLHAPYDIRGHLMNPMYNQLRWEDLGESAHEVLVVGRLDGPDAATAKRLVDDALFAERYGLQGRAYFDSRGAHDDGYAIGDFWLSEACDRFRREGYECVLDDEDAIWGPLFPMEAAAFYAGWYAEKFAGPFERADFRFQRGAIAYHNHSSNARSLRSGSAYWAPSLLSKGAAATMGAVTEPFLVLTPNAQIVADRLCRGNSFGESVCISLPSLSWQIAIVGDPLYTPFRLRLEEQMANLDADGKPDAVWADIRRINRLLAEGRFDRAVAYAQERIARKPHSALQEKLADMYERNGRAADAMFLLRSAAVGADNAPAAFRTGLRFMHAARAAGDEEQVSEMAAHLRKQWADSPFAALLDSPRK
jgi:uncharacterized protein (TIGR03790 family)